MMRIFLGVWVEPLLLSIKQYLQARAKTRHEFLSDLYPEEIVYEVFKELLQIASGFDLELEFSRSCRNFPVC